MPVKRIASFLPSATELLYELGAEDNIVGVTHECTYPDRARTKPRIINSVFDPEKMTSVQIDKTVSRLARNGESLFTVEEKVLREADPDLIIGQGTCAVCSAYTREVSRAMQILNQKPQVEVLDPHSVDDILASVTLIAGKIGKKEEGEKLNKALQSRINRIKSKEFRTRPKVLCIEWVEPFFTSGHWVPQMVEIAGGMNLASKTGERSRRMSIGEVEEADPDTIIMMPCGFDASRTAGECHASLSGNQKWLNLRAVRDGQVYGVDANSYFSKPSIRTVTGIEILAKIIHPDESADIITPENSFKRISF